MGGGVGGGGGGRGWNGVRRGETVAREEQGARSCHNNGHGCQTAGQWCGRYVCGGGGGLIR